MEKFELEIDEKTSIMVKVAKNKEDRKKGLSGMEKIEGGMLFVFPYTGKHQMWMMKTYQALDIIFMDIDGKVTEILIGDPEHIELLGNNSDTRFVLELPLGFANVLGLEKGDILPIPSEHLEADDAGDEPAAAQMLDDKGEPQMDIHGGERVFSRKVTREIVAKSLKAESEADFALLGKLVSGEIRDQDKRGAEYVDPKKTKYQYAEKGSKMAVKEEEEIKPEIIRDKVETIGEEQKKDCIVLNGEKIELDELTLVLKHYGYLLVCKKDVKELFCI